MITSKGQLKKETYVIDDDMKIEVTPEDYRPIKFKFCNIKVFHIGITTTIFLYRILGKILEGK